MIHKTDNDLWALPGGGREPGESIADTVVREVREEAGYDVEVETITETYTNPRRVIAYDDGEVRQQFSIAFRARLVGGSLRTSWESLKVAWLTADEIAHLNVHPSMRLRIEHALRSADRPVVGRAKTLPTALRGREQRAARSCDRAMNWVIRSVPTKDLSKPVLRQHRRPVGACAQVHERQYVEVGLIRNRQTGQSRAQPRSSASYEAPVWRATNATSSEGRRGPGDRSRRRSSGTRTVRARLRSRCRGAMLLSPRGRRRLLVLAAARRAPTAWTCSHRVPRPDRCS